MIEVKVDKPGNEANMTASYLNRWNEISYRKMQEAREV